ncbi:2,3-dihydroxybiphenyl 1,2-dioxygenase [Pradoshia sp. D12]|uniref:VOC family protein n=1 Tax=Bacillaceae TaxID=186817 RepID=UPI001129E2AE|nr:MULTISPECIES: VOC family protein [Bacillaceae]QFK71914.1 2,3-dihydroxybiphenyl 1,2-dioxygenase [Pradoshia sp. D12]TPF73708.1 2,3-dihydroxybiphenyl 1,2-dioxygenase [Bacillus sp. D12]
MGPRIAQLGYVALESSDIEKSVDFFQNIIGLELTEKVGEQYYFRAWGDFQHHTLSISPGIKGKVKHISFRTKCAEDVDSFASRLNQKGYEIEYVQAGTTPGIGRAIRFMAASGHRIELFYDVVKTEVEEHRRSVLKNQTYKAWAKGISPRRFDHVNIHTAAPENTAYDFFIEELGFRMNECIETEDGKILAGWMSVTPLVHDVALVAHESLETTARFHHISYWLDSSGDLMRAADILKEHDLKFIGLGKHSISQAIYLYVIDPGSGCRVELFTGGYLIFEPDWETVVWRPEERAFGNTYWGDSITGNPLIVPTIEA